jgi:hypothetical protein
MKRCMRFGGALLCLLVSQAAGAEVVQTKERTYAVKYKDDAVERYKVAWTANVVATVRELGGSPVPYQGSVDVRKCSWTIATTIDRTVSLATRQGATMPLPTMNRTYKEDFQNRGGEFLVTDSRNESCKDATAYRENAIGNARTAIRSLFERLTEADLENLKKEAQSKPDVATITVQ